jgi:hypothetical protein
MLSKKCATVSVGEFFNTIGLSAVIHPSFSGGLVLGEMHDPPSGQPVCLARCPWNGFFVPFLAHQAYRCFDRRSRLAMIFRKILALKKGQYYQ